MASPKEIDFRQAVAIAFVLLLRLLNSAINMYIMRTITGAKLTVNSYEYRSFVRTHNALHTHVYRMLVPLAGLSSRGIDDRVAQLIVNEPEIPALELDY